MNCGFGVFHRCCLSSVSEVWGFYIDVHGVKMKGIVTGDKVVSLCCMLDQSYIMQLNNYLLNILMKLPFAYTCGAFVKLFPFSFSMQDFPFFSRTATSNIVACYYSSCALAFHCIRFDCQLELWAGGTDCAPRWESPVS